MKKICICLALLMTWILVHLHHTAAEEEGTWGISAMGFDLLLDAASGGDSCFSEPVLVAVLDSGCDTGHAAFEGRISPDSRSFLDYDAGIADEGGHGTSVASVIAAATPANVQLLILRVNGPEGFATDDQFLDAILYAIEMGADVINMSIEITTPEPVTDDFRVFGEGIRRCRENGIPFVVGAGNEKMDTAYFYPAGDTDAIAVSAVRRDGKQENKSNYGAAIRFCAPGAEIRVAGAGTGDGYILSGGTSLAAPCIAAAAAWVKMLRPDASVDEVCQMLASCALDLGVEGRDDVYGEGMPQISLALLGRAPVSSFPETPSVLLISGTDGFASEGADCLFDGDDSTKWCVRVDGSVFAEWEQTSPIRPGAVILVTGNDNEQFPGRNPADARLYARNDTEEDWQLIWEQPSFYRIPDVNYEAFSFPAECGQAYRFFRIEITATTGSDIMQLARL